MKRIFCLVLLSTMLISSIVFAKCNLDTTRWIWVTSNEELGIFVDSRTIKINYGNVEFWSCLYYPSGCKWHDGEHYHYCNSVIDFNRNLEWGKAMYCYNSSGQLIDDFRHKVPDWVPILSDSMGESEANVVYELAYGKKRR